MQGDGFGIYAIGFIPDPAHIFQNMKNQARKTEKLTEDSPGFMIIAVNPFELIKTTNHSLWSGFFMAFSQIMCRKSQILLSKFGFTLNSVLDMFKPVLLLFNFQILWYQLGIWFC